MKIGTRGSALALAQSNLVAGLIRKKFPKLSVDLVVIKTTGDKFQDAPLSRIGGKGLFTKEIEDALLARSVDLAVHSLKDLPTEIPSGLEIGAILKREDPSDCLITLKSRIPRTLRTLPRGSVIGTSSLRRQSQLACLRKGWKIKDLRGNLDTRVRKLRERDYDAIVVAAAGLKRLGDPRLLAGMAVYKIPPVFMLPAVGQGALALEIRENDFRTREFIQFLDDAKSAQAAAAERAFLKKLEGGCQVPIGALATSDGKRVALEGLIASVSGEKRVRGKASGRVGEERELGESLARKLLVAGGREILGEIRP